MPKNKRLPAIRVTEEFLNRLAVVQKLERRELSDLVRIWLEDRLEAEEKKHKIEK